MEQVENKGNATTQKEVVEVEQVKPQTLEDIRKARVEKLMGSPEAKEEPKEVIQEESAEDADDTEGSTEEDDTEEQAEVGEDVLSQIDWDDIDDDARSQIALQAMELLPPEKLGELAKKMGSGSGKRIGELTSQIKELKSELASKTSALSSSLDTVIAPSNILASVTSDEDLDTIEAETKNNIRFYQRWLASDEDVFEHQGSEYTRSDVVNYISGLQDKYDDLPKQRKYLKQLSSATKEAVELDSKARTEFHWLDDDDSDTYTEYKNMIGSEDMAIISKVAPVLAAKLKYQLAHAANNMVKPKAEIKQKKIIIPRKVPMNAISGSSSSNSRNTVESNQVKNLKEAAKKGNLIAARQLRQLQINSRYT